MRVERPFISHFECSETGREYPADKFYTLSENGAPLLARYDLDRLHREVNRSDFVDPGAAGIWRFHKLLPLQNLSCAVSLGEVETPLIALKANRKRGVQGSVFIKDEGCLPTGSFKARGLSAVTSVAREWGIERLVIPTAGNAGAALSAYCAKAGIEAVVFCPADAIKETIKQISIHTDKLFLVDGLINDCGELIKTIPAASFWRDISTLKEPYRVEGKKTMGFEIAQQFGWRAPKYIFYPTGGGVGLIGIWKAFQELQQLGWLEGELPQMVAVQADGCAPIVAACEAGEDTATNCQEVTTHIHGMRVPAPFADRLMLKTLRDSDGFGVTVSDEYAQTTLKRVAREEGLLLSVEGAAVVAAYEKAIASGLVDPQAEAVLINSACGLKDQLPVDLSIVKNSDDDLAFLQTPPVPSGDMLG